MVEECGVVVNQGGDQEVVDLPPGVRFHPTNEEIITHYLKKKVLNIRFTAAAIGQADLNKSEPWDLPKIAKMGDKEFYLFCRRDQNYPDRDEDEPDKEYTNTSIIHKSNTN